MLPGAGGVGVVTVDFATALAEYEALLDRVAAALEQGSWEGFDGGPHELPDIAGQLDPALEARLAAAVARAAALRERVQAEAAKVAAALVDDSQRSQAHRRYAGS